MGAAVSDRSAEVRKVGRLSSSHRKSCAYLGNTSLTLTLPDVFNISTGRALSRSSNVATFVAVLADMSISTFTFSLGTGPKIVLFASFDRPGIIPADGDRQGVDFRSCDGMRSPEPHVLELVVLFVLM